MEGMFESPQQVFDAWAALKKAQTEAMSVMDRVDKLFQSSLSDLSLLPQIYEWYQNVSHQNGFCGDIRNQNHKQFILIVLMLYSPKSLCGGSIKSNLRQKVASLLQLRSHTILYYMRDKAVAWSKTYKTFSLEAEVAYREIVKRLREREIMSQ